MNARSKLSLVLTTVLSMLILATLVSVIHQGAHANANGTRYVGLAGVDSGACTNANTPCRTVQYAVDQAADGDAVQVATGVYTGVQARAGITQVAYISKTVALRGGYRADFGAWDPEAYSTTLDAEGQGRVIYATGPDITITLEGLRLTGGDASGLGGEGGVYDIGGGLCALQTTAHISGNVFFGNFAHSVGSLTSGRGGGLYLGQSMAMLHNNVIQKNTASTVKTGYGGGLFLSETAAELHDNLFQENLAATSTGTGFGGALYQSKGEVNLTGNTILSNTAKISGNGYAVGGGVYINSGRATLTGNAFRGNISSKTASSSWNWAGALNTHNSQVHVEDNTFEDNVGATYGAGSGGALFLTAGNVTLIDNSFSNNWASLGSTGWGGAVYLNAGNGTVLHGNTFRDNVGGTTDGWGGALDVAQSHNVLVKGNAFSDNTASSITKGQGGAIVLEYADITLEDNLIQGNTAWQGGGAYVTNWATQETLATWVNNVVVDNRTTDGGSGSVLYVTTLDGNVHNHLLHTTLARNAGGDGSNVYVDLGTVVLTNTLLYSHTVGVQNAGGVVSMSQTLWDSVLTPTLGTVFETGSFTGTAAFAADGYHLTRGSDAVDAGLDTGLGYDVDGERRPTGIRPDIGADEYPLPTIFLPLVLFNATTR